VRGPVRHLSGAQLDEMAKITAEDIERARQRWEQIGSLEVRDLLDAEPDDAVAKRGREV
jgi:hypothetical protein